MAQSDEILLTLNSIGQDIVEAAQRELGATRTVNGKKRRSVATGRLKDSLSFRATARYNNPVLEFSATGEAANYLRFVVEGRKKGARMPPIEPILKWMSIKRIRVRKPGGGFDKETPEKRRALAWNIARSISVKGIPANPFYSTAIENVLERRGKEFLDTLNKEIELRLQLK